MPASFEGPGTLRPHLFSRLSTCFQGPPTAVSPRSRLTVTRLLVQRIAVSEMTAIADPPSMTYVVHWWSRTSRLNSEMSCLAAVLSDRGALGVSEDSSRSTSLLFYFRVNFYTTK